MKQFQSAAAQQMNNLQSMSQTMQSPPPPTQAAARGPMGGGGGLFSMVGNLFGMNNAGMSGFPTMPTPPRAPEPEIENIIEDIHKEISSTPPSNFNRVETMSVSDEEITSIIEDTADLNGLLMNAGGGKRRGGTRKAGSTQRTLNL